jgi:hypothetical protein
MVEPSWLRLKGKNKSLLEADGGQLEIRRVKVVKLAGEFQQFPGGGRRIG